MTIKHHTKLELVKGGNVFKQGDHATLEFIAYDSLGNEVDLTNKQIDGALYSRNKGIVYEAPASFTDGRIVFTIDELVDNGKFQLEFTATDSADPDYRAKFPSDEYEAQLTIKPSKDNMDFVGVSMTTVAQLKNELQGLQTEFAGQVLPRVDIVEDKQTQLEADYQAAAGALTEDSEVILARKGEPTLRAFNDKVVAQLAETVKKTDTGVLNLNIFDEPTRSAIQGIEPGTINAVLGEGNVKPENTSFISLSPNIMDMVDASMGFTIDLATGGLSESVNFTTTKFLKVNENTTYTFIGGNRVGIYNSSNGYIENRQFQSYSTVNTFTTPAGATFVKVVIHNSRVPTAQMNKGTDLLPYEPYRLPKLSTDITVDGTLNVDLVYNFNLFKGDYIRGMIVSATTNSLYPSTNGRVAYIQVESGKTYTIEVEGAHDRFSIGFSNSITGQAPVSVVQASNNADAYSIITVTNSNNRQYLLVGVSASSQEPSVTICEGDKIAPTAKINDSKIMLEGEILPFDYSRLNRYSSYYETAPLSPTIPSTFAEVHALFDGLLALDGEYVQKTSLGVNAQGHPIIEYSFTKPDILNQSNIKRPKIAVLGSLHGDEKTPVLGMYYFMKELMENPSNNEVLDKLKANVDFHLIPCANPTGWNNHTRNNGQDVDLNRNFTTNWDATVSDKKGASPASELETQIIEEWMELNLFDYFIDYHTSNQGATDNRISWLVADNGDHRITMEKSYVKAINLLSTLWTNRHAEMPKHVIYGDIPPYQLLSQAFRHAGAVGSKACLLEVSQYLRYFSDVHEHRNTWSAELFGNLIFEMFENDI